MDFDILTDDVKNINNGEDSLNNLVYYEELKRVILKTAKTNATETIAIYGSWGSGKSSIIKTLIDDFRENNITVGKDLVKPTFFQYDAWKYSNDSFRENFMLDISNKSRKKKLEEIFYKNPVTTKNQINWDWKRIIVIIIFAIIIAVTIIFNWNDIIDNPISGIIQAIMILGLEFILYGVSSFLLDQESTSKTKKWTVFDFNKEFQKFANKKKQYKIIIIDNLDRCEEDVSLKILETVKGLLSSNNGNYIFIVPIDNQRIINELRNIRKYSLREANEFLSKVFDYEISIKERLDTNNYEMIKSINDKYNFHLPIASMNLIAKYYGDNPRKIKRIINLVNAERNLASISEKKNLIIDNEVTNNVNYVTKLCILRERWPEYYKQVLSDYTKLDKLDNENSGNSNVFEDYHVLKAFIKETRNYEVKNIEYFLFGYNTNFGFEKEMVEKILNGLELNENQLDSIEKNLESFGELVISLYSKYVILSDGYHKYSIFNTFVLLLGKLITNNLITNPYLKSFIDISDIISNSIRMDKTIDYHEYINQLENKYIDELEMIITKEEFVSHLIKIFNSLIDQKGYNLITKLFENKQETIINYFPEKEVKIMLNRILEENQQSRNQLREKFIVYKDFLGENLFSTFIRNEDIPSLSEYCKIFTEYYNNHDEIFKLLLIPNSQLSQYHLKLDDKITNKLSMIYSFTISAPIKFNSKIYTKLTSEGLTQLFNNIINEKNLKSKFLIENDFFINFFIMNLLYSNNGLDTNSITTIQNIIKITDAAIKDNYITILISKLSKANKKDIISKILVENILLSSFDEKSINKLFKFLNDNLDVEPTFLISIINNQQNANYNSLEGLLNRSINLSAYSGKTISNIELLNIEQFKVILNKLNFSVILGNSFLLKYVNKALESVLMLIDKITTKVELMQAISLLEYKPKNKSILSLLDKYCTDLTLDELKKVDAQTKLYLSGDLLIKLRDQKHKINIDDGYEWKRI